MFVHVCLSVYVLVCVCTLRDMYMNGGYMHSAGKASTCTLHVYDYIVGVAMSQWGSTRKFEWW